MTIEEEIEELNQLIDSKNGELLEIDEKIQVASAKSTDSLFPSQLATEKIKLELEIKHLNQRYESLISSDEIRKNIEKELDVLKKTESFVTGIEPIIKVIRPTFKLVDANLAYKYADLQSDVNTFLGLANLFLGVVVSFIVSLLISIFTAKDKIAIAIYSVSIIICLVVTVIFSILFLTRHKKSEEAKKSLEKEAGVNEVILQFVVKQPENKDEN